jgi:hypothetical protein
MAVPLRARMAVPLRGEAVATQGRKFPGPASTRRSAFRSLGRIVDAPSTAL